MRALCASLGWFFVSHLVCISLWGVFRSGHAVAGGAQVVENKGVLEVFAAVAKLLQMFLQVAFLAAAPSLSALQSVRWL